MPRRPLGRITRDAGWEVWARWDVFHFSPAKIWAPFEGGRDRDGDLLSHPTPFAGMLPLFGVFEGGFPGSGTGGRGNPRLAHLCRAHAQNAGDRCGRYRGLRPTTTIKSANKPTSTT